MRSKERANDMCHVTTENALYKANSDEAQAAAGYHGRGSLGDRWGPSIEINRSVATCGGSGGRTMNSMTTQSFSIHGIDVQVETDIPALAAGIEGLLRRFSRHPLRPTVGRCDSSMNAAGRLRTLFHMGHPTEASRCSSRPPGRMPLIWPVGWASTGMSMLGMTVSCWTIIDVADYGWTRRVDGLRGRWPSRWICTTRCFPASFSFFRSRSFWPGVDSTLCMRPPWNGTGAVC